MYRIALIAVALLISAGWARAQDSVMQKAPAETPSPPESKVKPPFTLKVTDNVVFGISLQAKAAKLTDIAAELSRKLKAQVLLSPVMQKQAVTVNFTDLVLETAMQSLAPVVYIDYEIDSAPGARPRPVGIYLHAYNEPPPLTNAVVKAKDQAFVISGNTEPVAPEDEPIHVEFRNGQVTARAKAQPMLDVISEIAEEAGVPLEAPAESNEEVTVDIKDRPLEQAILGVSPNLRVYVRADFYRATRTVFRIVVVERDKNP